MPDMPSPKALDVNTGWIHTCEREPAMDGAGNLAYSAGYAAYNFDRWIAITPDGKARGEFRDNPSPALWPQIHGFQMVTAICSSIYGGFWLESLDATGKLISEQPLGNSSFYRCDENEFDDAPDPAGGTVTAWFNLPYADRDTPSDFHYEVRVQRFNEAGQPRFEQVTVASWYGYSTPLDKALVVGTDTVGRTLVLWNGDAFFGAGSTAGRWLESDGTPLTPIFQAEVPPLLEEAHAQVLTPLLGGGLVLQRGGTWIQGFASGSPRARPAPDWLAGRHGRLERVRGDRAYALMPPAPSAPVCDQQVEILAPDGTSCGQLTFSSEVCMKGRLLLGAEGSVLQQQPLTHSLPEDANGCTLKWWPGVLR